jgi:poly(3-hydroxybutyrate) depolymerase
MKQNVCFDTTRVFATGFSFGGMITYSLSTNHQADIRAAVGIAPANYNIWLPEKTRKPIAWMHTTGLSDSTCPWVNNEAGQRGAKFIALEKAEDNGCSVPNDIPIWQNGGHLCYDFEDCDPEHPTRVCTFAGGHTNIDNEGGKNWIAQESWDFYKQF